MPADGHALDPSDSNDLRPPGRADASDFHATPPTGARARSRPGDPLHDGTPATDGPSPADGRSGIGGWFGERTIRPTLFWRTFGLITLLVAVSLVTGYGAYRAVGRDTQAARFARDVMTIVNMTHAGLSHTAPAGRAAFLDDLLVRENVRVIDAHPRDTFIPWPDATMSQRIMRELSPSLGSTTTVAGAVNGIAGLWIGFGIDDDRVWLQVDRTRLDRQVDTLWVGILAFAILLSFLGSLVLSQVLHRPLAQLAEAVAALTRGEAPKRLPERGPAEISELNHRFNLLARELQSNEAERALVMAGISHDIRTPLTRLRLEIEMSPLSSSDQRSMSGEIDRINAIVDQFIEYAQPPDSTTEAIDVADEILRITRTYDRESNDGKLRVECQLEHPMPWMGSATVIQRILQNLIENAAKYGRSPDGIARVEIAARRRGRYIQIIVRDHGEGVPPWALEWLYRPFARLDGERGGAGGTGLGLAVVSRLARRSGGEMVLDNASDGGLVAHIRLGDRHRSSDRPTESAGPLSVLTTTHWRF